MEYNQLKPFMFGEQVLRAIDENGNYWFVAKDVCDILELVNVSKSIGILDEDEKITLTISEGNPRIGIPHELNMISESGLYALVFHSRKPEARRFSKWVRSEVLPALRKTGRYEMPKKEENAELQLEVPLAALKLRPKVRQELWRDAIRTAQLDGGGADMVMRHFIHLCHIMAAQPPVLPYAAEKVAAFYNECCQICPGHRESAANLYEAFRLWHSDKGGDLPTKRTFGFYFGKFAKRQLSNGRYYRDIEVKI